LLFNLGGNEFSTDGEDIAPDAVTMLFEDSTDDGSLGPGVIRLTITFNGGLNVDAAAKINKINFNSLVEGTIAHVSGQVGTGASYDPEHYNSDGDHGYDFEISFPTSNSEAFTSSPVAEVSVFTITGTGLTTSSFLDKSDPGKKGPFYAAVHINAYDSGASGHFPGVEAPPPPQTAVPEPTTLVVWAAGLACLGVSRLQRRKNRDR
jgi:hypothetical protein